MRRIFFYSKLTTVFSDFFLIFVAITEWKNLSTRSGNLDIFTAFKINTQKLIKVTPYIQSTIYVKQTMLYKAFLQGLQQMLLVLQKFANRPVYRSASV